MGWLEKMGRNKKEKVPDPTGASVLPGSVKDIKYRFDSERKAGLMDSFERKYHHISRSGADQMVLARLVKGIIPVSDVVYDSEQKAFFSCEVPIQDVEKNIESMDANVFILKWIFCDGDHGGSLTPDHNIVMEDKRHIFYDFDNFTQFWWREKFRGMSRPDDIKANVPYVPQKDRQYIKKSVDELRARLGSEDGYKFISAVFHDVEKSTGTKAYIFGEAEKRGPDAIGVFQQTVIERLDAMREAIDAA